MIGEPGLDSIKEYRKIKAHQTVGEEQKSWQAKANDEADRLAKLGRLMHDYPAEASYGELKLQIKDLAKIVDLVLGVFPLWPSHTKSARLPAKERAIEKQKGITAAGGHCWERLTESWRCSLCLAKAKSRRTMLARAAEKCKAVGEQSFFDGLRGNGHKSFSVSFQGQADLVVCALCGKYVQEKKNIMQGCNKTISEAGKRALSHIANGQHPDRNNKGRVSRCYDESARRPVSYAALMPAKTAKPPRTAG